MDISYVLLTNVNIDFTLRFGNCTTVRTFQFACRTVSCVSIVVHVNGESRAAVISDSDLNVARGFRTFMSS